MTFRVLSAIVGLMLAGCMSAEPLPDQPGTVAAFEDHAWENGARCVLREMQVTSTDTVERAAGREVVQVRYRWSDERTESDTLGNIRNGFATRTFTIVDGHVTEMSGEQRS